VVDPGSFAHPRRGCIPAAAEPSSPVTVTGERDTERLVLAQVFVANLPYYALGLCVAPVGNRGCDGLVRAATRPR